MNLSALARVKLTQAANTEAMEELGNKFDLLYRQFQDLKIFAERYVPRDEVQEAMQAVLKEVKNIKTSTVSNLAFKDALRHKGEESEVQRLIKSLTDAMGNIDGRTNSSAVHSKCLVCDAPVNTITNTSSGRASSPNQILSHSQALAQSHYDKREDSRSRPNTSAARLGSSINRLLDSSSSLKIKDKIKVNTELKILRNSLDLPPISDSPRSLPSQHFSESMPMLTHTVAVPGVLPQTLNGATSYGQDLTLTDSSTFTGNANTGKVAKQAYKERIRTSAGGGVGPSSYKKDTR